MAPAHDELGVECTREEFYLYEGRTGASTINALFQRQFGRDATDEEKTSLYQRKTEYFRELPPVLPMEGALDMLSVFREVGMQRVLVTGSGQQSVLDNISRDFPGMFDDDKRITARNVTHGKPHPEPFIKAMQLARVSPSQSIVVENAPPRCRSRRPCRSLYSRSDHRPYSPRGYGRSRSRSSVQLNA